MNLYAQRVQHLRNELSEAGYDGCAFLLGANFAYYIAWIQLPLRK